MGKKNKTKENPTWLTGQEREQKPQGTESPFFSMEVEEENKKNHAKGRNQNSAKFYKIHQPPFSHSAV